RAEALIRGAEPASRLRLERLQPLVDVEIQLALPLRSALGLETQRLDLAAQRLRIRAQLLELIRDLYQAFVVDDALDAYQARLEILQPQIHRIVRRRDRAACREQAEGDDADREDDERASHGRFLEVGAIAETLTACKRSRLGDSNCKLPRRCRAQRGAPRRSSPCSTAPRKRPGASGGDEPPALDAPRDRYCTHASRARRRAPRAAPAHSDSTRDNGRVRQACRCIGWELRCGRTRSKRSARRGGSPTDPHHPRKRLSRRPRRTGSSMRRSRFDPMPSPTRNRGACCRGCSRSTPSHRGCKSAKRRFEPFSRSSRVSYYNNLRIVVNGLPTSRPRERPPYGLADI